MADSERPREKLFSSGAAFLSNTELLAILISCGTRDESALVLAARVLALENGNLSRLASCRPEEFMKIRGVGEACAGRLSACFELARRFSAPGVRERISMDSPDRVAAFFMSYMRSLHKEVFRVALVNIKNELISIEDVSVGGLDSASAMPREVFSSAVKRGAAAVILAHNHPSGDPSPSGTDISATRQLCEAGKLLGIRVLDHIIIGDGCYSSLREMSLID